MSMEFEIGQNDSLPKIFATLSADFDADYPEADQIVYNANDEIKLYIEKDNAWISRTATVEESIDGGKSVRVSVVLDPSDVETADEYECYFRNETIKLSFPTKGYARIYVRAKGHEAAAE